MTRLERSDLCGNTRCLDAWRFHSNRPTDERRLCAWEKVSFYSWHTPFSKRQRCQRLFSLNLSDGVLNPSGVRFGSSEIYNVLAAPQFDGLIADAMVVGQQRLTPPYSDPAEHVVLFVKCTPRASTGTLHLDPRLESAIRRQVEKDLSRRHVPTFMFEVEEVPYNANGKKLEIQVKAVLCGGGDALARLKVTREEFRHLKWFERFYDIDGVVKKQQQQMAGSKL